MGYQSNCDSTYDGRFRRWQVATVPGASTGRDQPCQVSPSLATAHTGRPDGLARSQKKQWCVDYLFGSFQASVGLFWALKDFHTGVLRTIGVRTLASASDDLVLCL